MGDLGLVDHRARGHVSGRAAAVARLAVGRLVLGLVLVLVLVARLAVVTLAVGLRGVARCRRVAAGAVARGVAGGAAALMVHGRLVLDLRLVLVVARRARRIGDAAAHS